MKYEKQELTSCYFLNWDWYLIQEEGGGGELEAYQVLLFPLSPGLPPFKVAQPKPRTAQSYLLGLALSLCLWIIERFDCFWFVGPDLTYFGVCCPILYKDHIIDYLRKKAISISDFKYLWMCSRQLFLVWRVIKTSHPSSQTPNYPSITDLCQKIWLRESQAGQTVVPLVLSPEKLWFHFSYNTSIITCQFTLQKPVLVNNRKEIALSTSLSANFVSFWSKVCFELTGNSFRRKVNCAVYRHWKIII